MILTTNQLTKSYGNLIAANSINLDIPKGTVYGILGPNGSGKTTTLGMTLGVINPSSGSYSWFGDLPKAEIRKRIGSLLETPNFYPHLSAVQNLKIACQIKDVPYSDIDRVLKIVNLYERRKSNMKTYSLGMKQRLAVASTLLGDPEVLVLDEPTNGLDPQGIAEMRNLIIRIAQDGKTILLASHILDEVEKVCTHVAILKKGELLANGPVEDIIGTNKGILVMLKATDMLQLQTMLDNSPLVQESKQDHQHIACRLKENVASEELNKYLYQNGVIVSEIFQKRQTLESQFLEITK